MKSHSRTLIYCSRATLLAFLLFASIATPALAQDQASADAKIMDFLRRTEISGFADGYYGYNFNTPATRKAGAERTFDVQHNSLTLSMAELSFSKVPTADSQGGFRIDLDYGATQDIVTPNRSSVFRNIGQAYVSYYAKVGKGLTLDFGKFVTPFGFEVIKAKDDWNYSRSLLFTLAIPFYHSGLRATYNLSDKVSLAGFVVNGFNNEIATIDKKTVIGQVTWKPTAAFNVSETYSGGIVPPNTTQWRHLSDTVATYTVNSKLSLAGNYDHGWDKQSGAVVRWQGVAAYGRVSPNSWFALTPRWEFYNDEQGFTSGTAQKLKEFTITSEFKHKDGFLTRMEYRYDYSDTLFYQKNGGISDHQNTFTVGLIYAFSTK